MSLSLSNSATGKGTNHLHKTKTSLAIFMVQQVKVATQNSKRLEVFVTQQVHQLIQIFGIQI